MFHTHGILLQTFLVVVSSFVLFQVGHAYIDYKSPMFLPDASLQISFYPPQNRELSVLSIIQCSVYAKPTSSIKWYDENWQLLSGSSLLTVTEDMRHWKQPITVRCLAYPFTSSRIDRSYTFRVADASRGPDAVSEIDFNPRSSSTAPTTMAVGGIVQCTVNGRPDPSMKWFDYYGISMSESSGLNVSEIMRHWNQPITLHCRADNTATHPGLEKSYTFRVAGASIGPGAVGDIGFNPPSSPESPTTVAVGETIQCTVNGRLEPSMKWYDNSGIAVSDSCGLYVSEYMRHWKQPITLHCREEYPVVIPTVVGTYTFQVYGAPSSGTEAWVIAVAVIVPIVVLAAIAIAAFVKIRRRRADKMSTTKSTSGSTAALLLQY